MPTENPSIKAREQSGFTLIELMIVVAIIAILAAIALPQYQRYVSKSVLAAALSELSIAKKPSEIMWSENRHPSMASMEENGWPKSGLTKHCNLHNWLLIVPEGLKGELVCFLLDTGRFGPGAHIRLDRDVEGVWTCSGPLLKDRTLLPKQCQG